MNDTTTVKRPNPGMSYGLIAGLIIVLITLVQYLGGLEMFMSPIGFVAYLIIITMAVLAALKARRQNEGFLEFADALKITFTVFALAFLLQTLFTYVLFNFIDVAFKEALNQEILIKTEQMMRKFGAPDSKIEEAMEQQRGVDPYAFGRIMLGYGITCIVSFIFCLLISLIVRKKKPEFNNI